MTVFRRHLTIGALSLIADLFVLKILSAYDRADGAVEDDQHVDPQRMA
jgi:hypothetical protein